MQIRVVYLGMLRDIAGRGHEEVSLAEGSRLRDLYAELEGRFPKLQGLRNSLALALNQEYADTGAELHDNDEVALLPPVSGGSDDDSTAETPIPLISEHARLTQRTNQAGSPAVGDQASGRRSGRHLRRRCAQPLPRPPYFIP